VEIEDPYDVRMKEFALCAGIDEHGIYPMPWKKKTKIHLCGDCFIGLYVIPKRIDIEGSAEEKRALQVLRSYLNKKRKG
jgi:hypothetical protein